MRRQNNDSIKRLDQNENDGVMSVTSSVTERISDWSLDTIPGLLLAETDPPPISDSLDHEAWVGHG